MRRGVKLGIGITASLLGTVLTVAALGLLTFVAFDGTLTTPPTTARTDAAAVVIAGTLVGDGLESLDVDGPATIEVESGTDETFVGVADAADVASFLDGVAFAEATRVTYPGGAVSLRGVPGRASADPPQDEAIWAASRVGDGRLTWELEEGAWSLVVMNTDGSPGIDVTGTLTVRVPRLGVAITATLALGAALALAGVLTIVSALRTTSDMDRGSWRAEAPTVGVPPRPDD